VGTRCLPGRRSIPGAIVRRGDPSCRTH
jgi:hypothetical protein